MSGTMFFVLLAVYAIVALKVEEWLTISVLGFRIETPQGFLEHPGAYTSVRLLLLVAAGLSAFITHSLLWYIGILVVAFAKFVAEYFGRKKAYASFRRLHRLLAADETDPNELAELEAGARLTDKELKARVALAREFAI